MEIWEIFRDLVTQYLPTLQTRRSPIPVPTHQAPMDGWMLLPFNLCEFALLLGYFQMGSWNLGSVRGPQYHLPGSFCPESISGALL